MKIIGLIFSISIVTFLAVWLIMKSLDQTNQAITTTQQLQEGTTDQTQQGIGPIDYSKQKVEEINQTNKENAEEINQVF